MSTRSENTHAPQRSRHPRVEPGEVREAAAQHDHVRIEEVDDRRQRPREALLVASERRLAALRRRRRRARRWSSRRAPRRWPRGGRGKRRVPTGRSRRSPSARSSRPPPATRRRAARAGDCGPTLRRPRSGPPRTRPSTTTPPPVPVPRITPKTTGAPCAGAVARLGQGEAVRVVREAERAVEQALEILAERAAVEPDAVRVLHEAGGGRERPRHPDARPARARRSRARAPRPAW